MYIQNIQILHILFEFKCLNKSLKKLDKIGPKSSEPIHFKHTYRQTLKYIYIYIYKPMIAITGSTNVELELVATSPAFGKYG